MTELQESVERARYIREKGQPPWPVDACRIVDAYLAERDTIADAIAKRDAEWVEWCKRCMVYYHEFVNKGPEVSDMVYDQGNTGSEYVRY